jgi:hypothetical protein
MSNALPGGQGPEPSRPPEPFEFTGDTPPAVARHLAAYAQHQAAAARFDAGIREFDAARLRRQADAAGRAIDAEARRADRLDRREAAEARTAARLEREAARDAHRRLREAVVEFTRQLRSGGVPPYHVLVTMTTIVRRAARDPEPLPDPDALTADVIEWALATYYGG